MVHQLYLDVVSHSLTHRLSGSLYFAILSLFGVLNIVTAALVSV